MKFLPFSKVWPIVRGEALIDVKVEDVGSCKKLLKIRVPQDDIKAKLNEGYEKLRDSANLSGFRKGRAPRKLLEKRFGDQVVEELKQTVMADASEEALKQTGLKTLGEPSFDSAEFKTDQDFTFDMTVEVEPDVQVADYKGLELKRLGEEVTDEQVDAGVKSLLRQIAIAEPVKEGGVAAQDIILCDWEIKVGEETALSGKGDRFEVREGIFSDLKAVNVPEKLAGASAGDTREITVTFPETYPLEKFQSKEGKLLITLNAVTRLKVPELNAESAKKLDFDSVDELCKHVREYIAARRKQAVREDLEHQAEEALLEKANFGLPEGLLKRQAQRNLDRQQMRLSMRGIPEEEITKRMDDLRASSEQAAERDFRLFFMLMKIAEAEKLFVTENEVEAAIARLANHYQKSTHKMAQELEQREMLSELRTQMRLDKTIAFLIDNAKIAG